MKNGKMILFTYFHKEWEMLMTEITEKVFSKVIVTVILSVVLYFLLRNGLAILMRRVIKRMKNHRYELFYDQVFFNRLAVLIPPMASYVILSFIHWEHKYILIRMIDIWLVVTILLILTSLLTIVNRIYESYPIAKNRPITFFIQLIKVFLYTIVVITIVSILVNKSPEHLIVGLSAFAAVLLLIFKDSLLGFVAGIQLTANKMIRIGDWIQMDRNSANGEVLEINLYTVKVQNWDMSISMIPTYQLVSESFTNWRGMQESGGRRIMRSINIDIHSVHFLSQEEIQKLANSIYLKEYINGMLQKLEEENKNKENLLDERQLTNIGVFRYYMNLWLTQQMDINVQMIHMVRQLEPGPTGIPVQIYCFSANKQWEEYEGIQADIFDHVMAVLPEFGLSAFEYSRSLNGNFE